MCVCVCVYATQDSMFIIDGTGVSVHFSAQFLGKTVFKQLLCSFMHLYVRYLTGSGRSVHTYVNER